MLHGQPPRVPTRCAGQRISDVVALTQPPYTNNLLGRVAFVERTVRKAQWQAEIYDLIAAYGQINVRNRPVFHVVHDQMVMTLDAALERVSRLLGEHIDWATIESFLPDSLDGAFRKSALASSFVAALELARMGKAELRQKSPFAPLYLKATGERAEA